MTVVNFAYYSLWKSGSGVKLHKPNCISDNNVKKKKKSSMKSGNKKEGKTARIEKPGNDFFEGICRGLKKKRRKKKEKALKKSLVVGVSLVNNYIPSWEKLKIRCCIMSQVHRKKGE